MAAGICQCEPGFAGHDCSVDVTLVPQHLIVSGRGYCDLASGPCHAVKVYGNAFVKSSTLKCKFHWVQVSQRHSLNCDGDVSLLMYKTGEHSTL